MGKQREHAFADHGIHRFPAQRQRPGIGLGDYLVRDHGEYDPAKHRFGKVQLCTFTAGFKREIFPKLRRAFEAPTRLRVPVEVEVREDLHEMQQIVKNGEYSYSARRTAEGHSDRCTSLALALHAKGGARGPTFLPRPFKPVPVEALA